MPPFLTPDTVWLASRLSARNRRRLDSVLRRLPARTRAERQSLAALRAVVGSLRGRGRRDFTLRPDVRAWMWKAEEALALLRPPRSARGLLEVVASGAHMAEIMPSGRLDRLARARSVALGGRLVARLFDPIPALLAFATPAGSSFAPLLLQGSVDGEEARARGEVHLWRPAPVTLRLPREGIVELLGPVIRVRARETASIQPRRLVPGTGIVLARRAVRSRGSLSPGPFVRGLERRLARALALTRLAWEEGYQEVLAHTRVVVPLQERGTVSFSQPARPGVSYINVWGKSLVDLADDLVHETAHHRLHGLEELGALVRRDDAAFYHSPWRRGPRPLRGILHACYTFTWRAELLSRLLGTRRRLPRRRLGAELTFEIDALRLSLEDLTDARRRGLLTPAGARVVRDIARRVERLASRTTGVRRGPVRTALQQHFMILYGHNRARYRMSRRGGCPDPGGVGVSRGRPGPRDMILPSRR